MKKGKQGKKKDRMYILKWEGPPGHLMLELRFAQTERDEIKKGLLKSGEWPHSAELPTCKWNVWGIFYSQKGTTRKRCCKCDSRGPGSTLRGPQTGQYYPCASIFRVMKNTEVSKGAVESSSEAKESRWDWACGSGVPARKPREAITRICGSKAWIALETP